MKCFYEAKLGLLAALLEQASANAQSDARAFNGLGQPLNAKVITASAVTLLAAVAATNVITSIHRDVVHPGDDPAEQDQFTAGLLDAVEDTIRQYLSAANERQQRPPQNFN